MSHLAAITNPCLSRQCRKGEPGASPPIQPERPLGASTLIIVAGVVRLGRGRWHPAVDHGRSGHHVEVLPLIGGHGPVRAAIVVAVMLAEKGANAVGAKIRDAVLPGPGQDDGVRKNDFVAVDAALEVA